MKVRIYNPETVYVISKYDDFDVMRVIEADGWNTQYVTYQDFQKQVEINKKLKNTIRKLKRRHNNLYEKCNGQKGHI